MGPFRIPWLTFGAWIVIGASLVVSIVWAAWISRHRAGDDR